MRLLIITFYKLKMMLSDKLFFVSMIIIPLFISLTTGYALKYEKLNVVPIAFVDEDRSQYSKTLLERLQKKEGITIEVGDREKAMQLIKDNKVELVFIVKEGFEEKIISGESSHTIDYIKSPLTFSADFVKEVVSGEVIRFTANHMAADWVLTKYRKLKIPIQENFSAEVVQHSDAMWEPKPLMTINYQEMEGKIAKDIKRNAIPAATSTSVGIVLVFIMFYILFSSGWLIEEKRNGTIKRLILGPHGVGLSFMGSVLALFISGGMQILLFSVIYKVGFQVELFKGIWSYAVFFAYLLAVISISMCLAAVLKTPSQLQAGGPVFALLTGFVGGCFWNFIEVPERLKRISLFTPQGWALQGINKLLLDPTNSGEIVLPMVVLLLLSIFLLPLSFLIMGKSVEN